MVIVELSDGLGNQMFQYAFGRHLSLRRRDRLVLFTGRFLQPRKRQYGLGAFAISGDVVCDLDCLRGIPTVWKVREMDMAFDEEVLRATCANLILNGCWQSERYFVKVAATIRQDFRFTAPIAPEHAELAQAIAQTASVCLHVRRTDYLLPQDTKGFIGVDYYVKAVHTIRSIVSNPVFYVFSDDIGWCRANLPIDCLHRFVSPDRRTCDGTVSDLQLMTACKHFIIANSTYSWWGAWLGSFEQKCVVAPQRWYRDDPQTVWDPVASKLKRSVDIIPERWLRV